MQLFHYSLQYFPFPNKTKIRLFIALSFLFMSMFSADIPAQNSSLTQPTFYRGIYLHNASSLSDKKMKHYIEQAKKHGINAFVMDVQKNAGKRHKGYRMPKVVSMVPSHIVKMVTDNGIWPIARVVVFDQGFNHYPITDDLTNNRLEISRQAVEVGFREIQYDYIRFEDSGRLKKVTLAQRYEIVEGFLRRANQMFKPKGIIIAADVYGRIPLNKSDIIGQRMEGFAEVVDIIAPMAYPSHYTWSKKLLSDPYYTVFITSQKGAQRVKGKADVVTWIQGFKMKYQLSGLSFVNYILAQIRAVEKSGVRGYLIWNAAQNYEPIWQALKVHNSKKK